jgi:hypothetical protein
VSYSLLWRRVVVADILAIAAGFVLRALAGCVATDIYLSRWFVTVTACGAIFLVAKRYSELREHAGFRCRARRCGVTRARPCVYSRRGGNDREHRVYLLGRHPALAPVLVRPFR